MHCPLIPPFPYTFYGVEFTISVLEDEFMRYPWEEVDTQGSIRTVQRYPGATCFKDPGEVCLFEHSRNFYLYDYKNAVKSLRRAGLTGPAAAAAANAEMKWLRDWVNDRWQYGVIKVALGDAAMHLGGVEIYDHYTDDHILGEYGDQIHDLITELLPEYNNALQTSHAAGQFPSYAEALG